MLINFIGNFQNGPGGEPADETHLADSLEKLGNTVKRIPRDEWREYVIEKFPKDKYKVPSDLKADINIICKWHHFFDGSFVKSLSLLSEAPTFYFVWDYMYDGGFPAWHIEMAQAADLLLSGELGLAHEYRLHNIKFYYFQLDSPDKNLKLFPDEKFVYDVVYLGSRNNQAARMDLLDKIAQTIPITVFAYDYPKWIEAGYRAFPAVYGNDFNKVVAQSKIVLGTSGGPHCFGYWSNRVGKVLRAGGFLLQQYTPYMEQFLPLGAVKFFSTPDEAIEQIYYYLSSLEHIKAKHEISQRTGNRFTSLTKMMQLTVLVQRYLKENKGEEWILP